MAKPGEIPKSAGSGASDRRHLAFEAVGLLLVLSWCLWWGAAVFNLALPGAARTWLTTPLFGADFWSQPDWAVRIWDQGVSPYDVEHHIFHYPPIVIQLFRWSVWFSPPTSLRIWVVALIIITVVATLVAHRTRAAIGLGLTPLFPTLAFVLFGFPVVFALERSNFDLITMVAIVLALGVLKLPFRHRELVAGLLLAFGPWVKIYPGLIGVALVALRWWKALLGFVIGGLVIGVLEPTEMIKSLKLLHRLMEYSTLIVSVEVGDFFPWSHSLSSAVRKALVAIVESQGGTLGAFPSGPAALLVLTPLLGWVLYRVYRVPNPAPLAFPAILWVVALASFVPEVANDYSLVFLPVAAVSVWSRRDPWPIQALFVLWMVSYQPIAFPINGYLLLASKLCGLAAVGAAMIRRARELGASDTVDETGTEPRDAVVPVRSQVAT